MLLPTTISVTKRDGKLVNTNLIDKVKFDTFQDSLKDGDVVEVTYEKAGSSGSYGQISKIKVSIRALAKESGETFEKMEEIVKMKSGLEIGGKFKSFADCSKDELSETIKVIIELGDILNVNCH